MLAWIFGVILVALIGLTILFAAGELRFGVSGTTTYVIYVVAGLLSAVVTFGLLVSTGTLAGEHGGYRGQVGGAIVALVLVVAFGAIYERYFHVPDLFSVRLDFYVNDATSLQPVTGTLQVFVGTRMLSETLNNEDSVEVDGISSDQLGKPLRLSLSADYEVDPTATPPVIVTNAPMMVRIRLKRISMSCDDAKLALRVTGASSVAAGPFPDKDDLVLDVRVVSNTRHPVYLGDSMSVALLTNGMVPLQKYRFDNTMTKTFAAMRGADTKLDGLVSKDHLGLLSAGTLLQVTATCEDPDDANGRSQESKTFSSDPMAIDRFLRDASL